MDAFQQARTQEGGQQGTLQSVLDQYQPQTEAGLNLFTDMLTNRQEPEPVTLSKVENGMIREVKVPRTQAQTYLQRGWQLGGAKSAPQSRTRRVKVTAYKGGKKVPMMIPEANYNERIRKLQEKGYSFDEPARPQEKWSEPFQKGSQWLQRNLQTGKLRKAYQEPDSTPSAKEKEIQRYLRLGIADTEQQATKLAEGLYQIGQDALGNSVVIDTSTGEPVKALDGKAGGAGQGRQGGAQKNSSTGQSGSYISMEDIERSFGPVNAIKRTINDVFGWAVSGQIYPEEERSANRVQAFAQRLRPFLQVSSRGAKWDVDNINKVLPTPKTFKDPDSAKNYVKNLTDLLQASIQSKQDIIANEDLTPEQLRTFNDDINRLHTAMYLLPKTNQKRGQRKGQPGQEQPGDQTSGNDLTAQDIQQMSADDLRVLDTESLTPEQRKIVEQRVDELLSEQGE
jgi:hypothetical protein